jgi:hypothetical protein
VLKLVAAGDGPVTVEAFEVFNLDYSRVSTSSA